MFVPFESLADSSRVWIYQTDRKLSSSEKEILSQALFSFTEQWQVHGEPMKTSFKLEHDQFVVLAADEDYNAASGCSIDGSVRVLKELGRQLAVDFFNRNLAAFKKEEKVTLFPLTALREKNLEGYWNEHTLFFNNLVSSKGGLRKDWIVPAGSTWLKRYLPVQNVSVSNA